MRNLSDVFTVIQRNMNNLSPTTWRRKCIKRVRADLIRIISDVFQHESNTSQCGIHIKCAEP